MACVVYPFDYTNHPLIKFPTKPSLIFVTWFYIKKKLYIFVLFCDQVIEYIHILFYLPISYSHYIALLSPHLNRKREKKKNRGIFDEVYSFAFSFS